MQYFLGAYKTAGEAMTDTFTGTEHVAAARKNERCLQIFNFGLPSWRTQGGLETHREDDPRLEPIKEDLKTRYENIGHAPVEMWSSSADPDGSNRRHEIVMAFPAKDAAQIKNLGNDIAEELRAARPYRARLYVGVNEGYQGDDAAVTNPSDAVEIVKPILASIVSTTGDKSRYAIYPGVAVYDRARGCPNGGEAVATLLATGTSGEILCTARELRNKLNQSTLAVGGDMPFGQETTGFVIRVAHPMNEVSSVWQVKAADENATDGLYVACGMYETDQSTIITAEANPSRYKDLNRWEAAVDKVAGAVGHQLGIVLEPEYQRVGFTSIRKPGV